MADMIFRHDNHFQLEIILLQKVTKTILTNSKSLNQNIFLKVRIETVVLKSLHFKGRSDINIPSYHKRVFSLYIKIISLDSDDYLQCFDVQESRELEQFH
uniref:Uncharacterized protein n=1 Tax=Strongyloides papillosus TaxID=174720 RepID=A0A0N5BJH9_STREA